MAIEPGDFEAPVPDGGILEMRSREPTVRDDLPPWCRMVGHVYLGSLPGEGAAMRLFVRKRPGVTDSEKGALEEDKKRVAEYEWRLRVRSSGRLGLGTGDPGLVRVEVKCFASTMADAASVQAAWTRAVERSPVATTLARATDLDLKLAIL